tara:strand:+ start:537 stop:734 length:198 start_codon:yes stop_codon:yes gene_type:complete
VHTHLLLPRALIQASALDFSTRLLSVKGKKMIKMIDIYMIYVFNICLEREESAEEETREEFSGIW